SLARDLRATQEAREATPPEADAGLVAAPDYAEEVRALGEATARMHLALADAHGDAAFEPEPLTEADLRRDADRVRARLARLEREIRRLSRNEGASAEYAASILHALPRV